MEGGGGQNNNKRRVWGKAAVIQKENNGIAQEIAKDLQETNDIGKETLQELQQQGEQLNRTEKALEDINANLGIGEKYLSYLESWAPVSVFGYSSNQKFETKNNDPTNNNNENENENENENNVNNTLTSMAGNLIQHLPTPSSLLGYWTGDKNEIPENDSLENGSKDKIPEKNVHLPRENQQMQDELSDSLKTISDYLGETKSLAKALGTEVDNQNIQLDKMSDKMDSTNDRIADSNKRIDKLLKPNCSKVI